MTAEQAPLDLVSTAVGSTRLSFSQTFFLLLFASIWASTWANLVDREVSDFGLFALPLNLLVGFAGFASIYLVYAEFRALEVPRSDGQLGCG